MLDNAVFFLVHEQSPALNLNILSKGQGYNLTRYRRTPPQAKGGGLFGDNPLSEGRVLVYDQLTNGEIEFDLSIAATKSDTALAFLQDLLEFRNRVRGYWKRENGYPPYLRLRGPKEANLSYLLIKNVVIPEVPDVYAQPFTGASFLKTLDKITINLEYGDVTESKPGTGTALELAAAETFNSLTLGNTNYSGTRVPTTENIVYLANRRNIANLTHIYTYNATTTTWSGNQQATAAPISLLSAPFAIGDAIYFGIQSTLTDSGPFGNLIVDLDHGVADLTGTWEVYTGAWSAPPLAVDQTSGLQNAGVNSFNMIQHPSLTTVNLQSLLGGTAPNITGFWLRFRITAVGGAPTGLVQENRRMYAAIWPYVDLDGAQVPGTKEALARAIFENVGDESGAGNDLGISRLILATRQTSRGLNFTACLNVADEQNPTGVTVTVGTNTSFANFLYAPSGRTALYSPGSSGEAVATRATLTLASTLLADFYGSFRAFLRVGVEAFATAPEYTLQLRLSSGSGFIYTTPPVTLTLDAATVALHPFLVVDFGEITFPLGELALDEAEDEIALALQIGHVDGSTSDLSLVDLWLMPADEWIGDFLDPIAVQPGGEFVNTFQDGNLLDVDSLALPRTMIRAIRRDATTDKAEGYFQTNAAVPFALQPQVDQRLWAFAMKWDSATDAYVSSPFTLMRLQMWRNSRYTYMRGNL